MNMRTAFLISMLFLALIVGCQGGRYGAGLPEETADVYDSTKPLIFAETDFLNIDIDMMARQFQIELMPAYVTVIDSATALNSVYEMLFDSLLGVDAKDFDLATAPHLLRQYEDLREDYIMRRMWQEEIIDKAVVPDSVVRAAYDENLEQFKVGDQYRAQHIVISGENLDFTEDSLSFAGMSETQRDSIARERVVSLRERAVAGANFDTLAMLYSQDPGSGEAGGDLGYFRLDQMVSPFDSTVEHTPIDSISGVIKTKFGWHIVKVLDFSPEHYLPYDSVQGMILKRFLQQEVQRMNMVFLDSVRAEGTVRFDSVALATPDSILLRQSRAGDTITVRQSPGEDDGSVLSTNPLYQFGAPMAYINPDDTLYGNDTLYFEEYYKQLSKYERSKQITGELLPEQKQDLISSLAIRLHLHRAARKLGYYDRPDVTDFLYRLRLKYGIATLKKEILEDDYVPTEEDMRAYYDANIDEYRNDKPLKVQHIVLADSNLAEHVRDLARSGVDFMELVKQYYPGEPDIREAAADLGYIGQNEMPREFWRAALATPTGDISAPVKTEYGYHLIKVLDKNYSISFDRAKSRLRGILAQQHTKDVVRNFVEEHIGGPPRIHYEHLDKLYRIKPDPDEVDKYINSMP